MKKAIKNNKLILSLITILVIGSLFFIFKKDAKLVSAWYSDSYHYRQTATVTNNTGTILTDYQLKISLDTATMISASQLQSDCDDLRFADISGQELPYWIESGCNSATTKIWVKAAKVPMVSSIIYVYYGNSTAPSAQNGDNTFELFDDFLSPNINYSKWDVAVKGTGGNIGVTGAGEATLNPTPTTISSVSIKSKKTFTNSVAIETRRMLASATTYLDFSLGGGSVANQNSDQTSWWHTDLANGYTWWSNGAASNNIALTDTSGGITNLVGSAFAVDGPFTTYQRFQYIYDASGGLWWLTNDSYKGSATNTVNLSNNKYILLTQGEHSSGAGDTQSIDWVFVRKIAGTPTVSEPSVGAFGTAEVGEAPVAYWKFDEGYGATTYDESASANDGTIVNATWQADDSCKMGKCISFDGSGDYVSTPNTIASSTLNFGTSDFTISAWIKPNATAGYLTVVSKGGQGAANTWSLMINENTLRWSGAANDFSSVGNQFIVGQWYYIVASIDVGGNAVFYKNGEQIKTQAWTTVNLSNNYAFYIGNESYSGAQSFNGAIDEVKIYPYARTAAQIKKDYASGRLKNAGTGSGAGVVAGNKSASTLTDGLVGWWKMDEASWNGTASEVRDSSGVGNHGQAVGAGGITGTSSTAKYGKSGGFDGTDDRVAIPTISLGKTHTLSAWAKGNTSDGTILGYDGGSYGMYYTSQIFYYSVAAGFYITWPYTVSNSSSWHHYLIVRDEKNVTLYVDGQNYGTKILAVNNALSLDEIGSTAGAYFWNGAIDDVRLYNRALSSAEIRRLYTDAPPPVLHLKLDEGTGQYAFDNSGRSATGTLGSSASASTDDPTWASASSCKYGGCLSFDGGDYTTVADNAVFSPPNNYGTTIQGWFKTSSLTDQAIIAKSSANQYEWGVLVNNAVSGKIRWQLWTAGGGEYASVNGSTTVTDGKWHHFAATLDYGVSAKLYVDGILDGSDTSLTDFMTDLVANVDIGRRPDGLKYFNGSIDDIRIYNYVRTPTQIREDMLAGAPVYTSPRYSVAPNAPNSTTNSSGMVAYWKFDEGTTSTYAYDSTSNNNDGTYFGSVSSTPGKFGRAVDLDGTSGYISVSDSVTLDPSKQITVSAWIKLYSLLGANATIVSKPAAAGTWASPWAYYLMRVETDSTLAFWTNSWTARAINSKKKISLFTWTHVVATYDGSQQKLYINGVFDSLNSVSGDITDSSQPLAIGIHSTSNSGELFNGKIDEVKIYNVALTEDEIKADYNKGKAMMLGAPSSEDVVAASGSGDRPAQSSPGGRLVGWWKMDEKSGQRARDASGTGNDGTLGASASASTDDPTWKSSTVCHSGSCLSFDGTADYITIPDKSTLRFTETQAFTWSLWFKGGAQSAFTGLIEKRSFSRQEMSMDAAGTLTAVLGDGTNQLIATTATTYNDNKWHHYLMVYNGANLLTVYVDAISSATDSSPTLSGMNTTGIDIKIGKNATPVYWNGSIDDAKIWNYALSQAEIAYEYNRGQPVGWWKFDEKQGDWAYDASGNGNHGYVVIGTGGTQSTTSSAWTAASSSKVNGGMSFDGTDDRISVPDNTLLRFTETQPFSMALWFKTSANETKYFIGKRSGNDRYALIINNGKISFEISDGSNVLTYETTDTWNNNQWHSAVVIYNGSNLATLYIDGIFKGTDNSPTLSGLDTTASAFTVGSVLASYYTGFIDDARIYNYALSASQIKQIYNNGLSVYFK